MDEIGVATMRRFLIAGLAAILIIAFWRPWRPSAGAWKESLEYAVAGADRLTVRPVQPDGAESSFKVSDLAAIDELLVSIEVDSVKSGSHCKCVGNPVIEFFKDGKLLASLGLAHGDRLKWWDGRWKGDAHLTLASQAAIADWLRSEGNQKNSQDASGS